MAVPPPLGDSHFGHQNGPNLHKLPVNGNAASHVLQRALIKRVGDHMVSDVTGNYKSILAAKDVCNDVIAVFIGDEKSIMYTAVGQAFNFSYAHTMNVKSLRDQIIVVVVRPAPVCCKNVNPETSATFWIERFFDKITRHAKLDIPGSVVNTIETLKTKLASFNPLGVSSTTTDRMTIAERYDQFTQSIIESLSQCFSPAAFTMKEAMEKGVVDQATMCLVQHSIPFALANVAAKFATSIAEGTTPGDWENNAQLQKNLAREYAKKTCETTFALAKNPEYFFPELIECGSSAITKVAHLQSKAIVYGSAEDTVFDLGGIILLSYQAFRFVTTHPLCKNQLRNGYLLDKKPAFYKPTDSFIENDPTKSIVMLYDDEKHEKEKGGVIELIKSVREKGSFPSDRTKGEGALSLSEMGRTILAGKKLEDGEARRSTRTRYRIGEYEVKEQCQFVLHRGTAYVVDHTREYMPLREQPDFYGRTPSLVATKKNLFRVSVGDIDKHHELLHRWIARVCSSGERVSAADIDAHALFLNKPVTAHTPGLSTQRLTFSSNELRTTFLDPALYDATLQENAMNFNLKALAEITAKELLFMRNIFSNMLSVAQESRTLFENYWYDMSATGDVTAKGSQAKNALESIELHPFFNVRTREDEITGKKIFALQKRMLYLQIPLLCNSVIKLRGLQMLARGARDNEICQLNNTLIELMSSEIKEQYGMKDDPGEKCSNLSDSLASIFKKVFVRGSFRSDEVNFLFSKFTTTDNDELPANWLITKYVIIPVITRGRTVFENGDRTSLREKRLEEDVVKIQTVSEFKMFEQDRLFRDDYVMSANTHWITVKSNWPPILQAAALFMQYCLTTPTALSATILENVHPGYAVDFIHLGTTRSEQAMFTVSGAYEMILSPGGVFEKEKGDGSIEVAVKCDIHTTRNTLGAGTVLVPSVFPNVNAIPGGENAAGSPIVTRDNITRTEYGTLAHVLAKSQGLSDKDKEIIKQQLGVSTRHKHVHNLLMGTDLPDEFVPIIRPVAKPTECIQPIMGIEKSACMRLSGSSNTAWERFYRSGEITQNSYASKMCSLYQMRYTKDNTVIGNDRTLLLRSLCVVKNEVVCSTTAALEELYDLSHDVAVLMPSERASITLHSVQNFDNVNGMSFKQEVNDPEITGRPIFGLFDVPAVMGFTIPYTQSTDVAILEATSAMKHPPGGSTKILKGPTDYHIVSPFTIPPPRNIMA